MMKKLIALVLALVLCLGLLAGCGETEVAESTTADIDFDAAFAQYDPDTVVMTVNGEAVTWSEFYYMLYSGVSQLQYYLGDMGWDDKVLENYDETFGEYSLQLAMDSIRQFHALSKQAAEDGILLDDTDKETIAEVVAAFKEQNLGADATTEDFEAFLLEEYYLTKAVYEFINESSLLYEKLFAAYIGQTGEKLTDADVQKFVDDMPYITAKHILFMTVDASGAALPEEEVIAAKTRAEDVLEELQGITNQKKLVKKFDELLELYNQDEGETLFTGGYTFTKDEMYPVFEEAAFALEEYQISGIVESQAGYHIIMRLPTTRDSAVDYDYENGQMYTIATYAATNKYSQLIEQWMDAADVVWEPEFEGITAEKIFS